MWLSVPAIPEHSQLVEIDPTVVDDVPHSIKREQGGAKPPESEYHEKYSSPTRKEFMARRSASSVPKEVLSSQEGGQAPEQEVKAPSPHGDESAGDNSIEMYRSFDREKSVTVKPSQGNRLLTNMTKLVVPMFERINNQDDIIWVIQDDSRAIQSKNEAEIHRLVRPYISDFIWQAVKGGIYETIVESSPILNDITWVLQKLHDLCTKHTPLEHGLDIVRVLFASLKKDSSLSLNSWYLKHGKEFQATDAKTKRLPNSKLPLLQTGFLDLFFIHLANQEGFRKEIERVEEYHPSIPIHLLQQEIMRRN